MKTKYTAAMLFEDFRHDYPELWRYGTQYQLYDFMTILIKIPTVGVVTYQKRQCDNVLKWLEHWEDPAETKNREKENLRKDHEYFLIMLEDIMEDRELTQEDVANITGYSRVSINRYLMGKTKPTYNTMKDIMYKLGFEDF